MMQWVQQGVLAALTAMLIVSVINVNCGYASYHAGETSATHLTKDLVPNRAVGRIIGGEAVYINATPYVVSFRHNDSHVCGGCVVGPSCIVTAAHCCQVSATVMSINAGSTYSNVRNQYRTVSKFVVHPNYKMAGGIENDYDCCLLSLSSPLDLSGSECKMVALADSSVVPVANDLATVCGWGLVTPTGKTVSKDLMSVQVPIVSQDACQRNYPKSITGNMICAGQTGKDSCQGDSGGPLVSKSGELIGVVSWGIGCAEADHPGVYCRVSAIYTWITQECSSAKTATAVRLARSKRKRV